MFIDSHCHLAEPTFDADRDHVIARARLSGAEAIVCIGESPEAADRARTIAASHPDLIAWTAGVHPHDAQSFDECADTAAIRQHVAAGAVAVGECGLDYHYENSPRERQRHAFASQLALAGELRRPVVVHTRDAEADTRAMVIEAGANGVTGVMHCFTGSHLLARAALDAGWYVSFSGIVTFRRWADDDLIRLIPDDRLLVESDAPYLAPVPHRGNRNEPAWVQATISRLAGVRGTEVRALAERTTENARILFALATAPRT